VLTRQSSDARVLANLVLHDEGGVRIAGRMMIMMTHWHYHSACPVQSPHTHISKANVGRGGGWSRRPTAKVCRKAAVLYGDNLGCSAISQRRILPLLVTAERGSTCEGNQDLLPTSRRHAKSSRFEANIGGAARA